MSSALGLWAEPSCWLGGLDWLWTVERRSPAKTNVELNIHEDYD